MQSARATLSAMGARFLAPSATIVGWCVLVLLALHGVESDCNINCQLLNVRRRLPRIEFLAYNSGKSGFLNG